MNEHRSSGFGFGIHAAPEEIAAVLAVLCRTRYGGRADAEGSGVVGWRRGRQLALSRPASNRSTEPRRQRLSNSTTLASVPVTQIE